MAHVEMTLNCTSNTSSLLSANSGYVVSNEKPAAFVVGEAVMCNTAGANTVGSAGSPAGADDTGLYGIISSVTYVDGDVSKNVSSITIKTNANNKTIPTTSTGGFVNGCFIWANANAQTNAVTGLAASNTQMHVDRANGHISNVFVTSAGSGYIQNPTITLQTVSGVGTINAIAQSTGEERNSGGPIRSKYISRRVSLKDGFDASDLKVILNAYKQLVTNIHVYYKIKNADDPDDFDIKNYTLMSQETSSGTVSKGKEDVQEFIYKTPSDSVAYTSNKVRYETFKTFAIKIAMVANTTYDMPKVKDMRAIALD